MQFFIKTLLFSLLIFSCNQEVKRDGYLISGSAKGIYNGIRVYLKAQNETNRLVDIDTTMVINEKFTFEGKVDDPLMVYVNVTGVNGNFPMMIENTVINLDIDKDDIINSKLTGSKSNEALASYFQEMKMLSDKRRETSLAIREASQANDVARTQALQSELNSISTELTELPFEFIKNNPDNHFSLALLDPYFRNNAVALDKVIAAFESLDNTVKNSEKGKASKLLVENAKQMMEAQKRTEIGKIAPNFSAPTPEGKILALNDIKGKITMIDFWAAWCGPCRRENPNIVKVYEKYHDKGLEIIGVSLDGNPRQPNAKADWIKAIEDDKLTWHQISNLNYFEDPIAKTYNIRSIPSSFVLDAEGRIIAKDLRGPELEAKISELLD